jgi:hypothetical protein
MADACNAATRNIYPRLDGTRYLHEYRHGTGMTYDKSFLTLSWPVKFDIPNVAQPSKVCASASYGPRLFRFGPLLLRAQGFRSPRALTAAPSPRTKPLSVFGLEQPDLPYSRPRPRLAGTLSPRESSWAF